MHIVPLLKKAAAFVSGGLFVTWVGGSVGAAAYKTAYWLFLGAWPETALYGLAPPIFIRYALSLPKDEILSRILLFLLTTDILTYLLVVPPLLLAPSLLVLLLGQGPRPVWSLAAKPFATAGSFLNTRPAEPAFRRNRGFTGLGPSEKSTDRGTRERKGGANALAGGGSMPPATERG